MALWDARLFEGSRVTAIGKVLLLALVVIPAAITTVYNIATWDVRRPYGFVLLIAGLICFLVSKGLFLLKRFVAGFSGNKVREYSRNFSRAGYWLMGVGLVLTFA